MIYILSFLISFSVPDSRGWVSLAQPQKVSEEVAEDEEGAWVVFFKDMGAEKFLVRFPEDPSCTQIPGGVLLEANNGEERVCLRVESGVKKPLGDRSYDTPEGWAREKVFATSNFVYTLKTFGEKTGPNSHQIFVDSIDVF